jgi:aryl-alcohol dehydrogenase-like predicted oxidoreductase
MDYVKFGSTDYRVSRMGLGCMRLHEHVGLLWSAG